VRILFIAPYVPSPIRIRPFQLIRHLSLRHSVTALVAVPRGEEREVLALQQHCEQVVSVPLRRNQAARSCAIGALRGDPLQSAYCRSPELSGRLSSVLAEGRFDVVHVEHLRAAHLLFEIPRGQPVVYDAVDCIALLLERTLRSSHSWKQRVIASIELSRTRKYETRVLRRSHSVIVTSDDDARALSTTAPHAPITVVPNGVDLDYFRPSCEAVEPATLVVSGKMSYHANVTAVLHLVRRILPLVRLRHPAVRLRIVGSNPPSAIQDLEQDHRIEVTGHVADVRPAIGSAAVAVCPVTVKVGIQNKILEAMALGVPVVSTQAGAVGLQARPGHDLLVGRDDAEVASLICDLLDNPTLRTDISAAGRRYVEANHRWEDVCSELERVYERAIVRSGQEGARIAVSGARTVPVD
jgi:polysaccharide biosynthesis protein PslH